MEALRVLCCVWREGEAQGRAAAAAPTLMLPLTAPSLPACLPACLLCLQGARAATSARARA